MKLTSALLFFLPLLSQAVETNSSSLEESRRSLKGGKKYFQRVSNFFICNQVGSSCEDDDLETVAEIVSATDDGMTLVYTDSEQENIGFVDITDPLSPVGLGVVNLTGEPTSVAVKGNYAAVGVNTSADYINTSGVLAVIDVASKTIVRTIDLGGQPDSVAFSPDGNYIVVAIENERDEDLGEGIPPQMPAGYVVVIDSSNSDPSSWTKDIIDVTDLEGVGIPEDPEPEFVSVNEDNIAVVTMQENNAIVLIDLETKTVIRSFSAGTVDLENIDTEEEGVIDQTSSLTNVPREPDGVVWISNNVFVTADEGDMDGGSRGFTVFSKWGKVLYSSGSFMDQYAASIGRYPEDRSGNKGVEPENVAYGQFGNKKILFVNAERANLSFVYDIKNPRKPRFLQVLPTSVGPEGGLAIPSRDLYIVACEKDDRGSAFRATLSIFQYGFDKPSYPTLKSWMKSRKGKGIPIPFGAMSGLSPSANKKKKHVLYAIEDSFYAESRIFKINTKKWPYMVQDAMRIKDTEGVFANIALDSEFDSVDLAAMINDDGTVNLDPEGIAEDEEGNFWVASEGKGTYGNGDVSKINIIFKINKNGVIKKVVTLPDEVAQKQLKWGLEGIAYNRGTLAVVTQRPWQDSTNPLIMAYDIASDEWMGHLQYPLDAVESPAGGWVGLSDITFKDDGVVYILERDNQGGPDARVKRVYSVDLTAYDGLGEEVSKTLVVDLLPILDEATQGLIPEKIEGLACTKKGLFLSNDNDGLDDNVGDSNLWNVGDYC